MNVHSWHFRAIAGGRSGFLGISLALALALVTASAAPLRAQTSEPPLVIIDQAVGTGTVVRSPKGPAEIITVAITDTFSIQNLAIPPRDTIPVGASVEFHWYWEPRIPGSYPVAYRYKLDEATFVSVDTSVHSVRYDGLGPGNKIFFLRVVDSFGMTRETNRRFRVGYSPDTWIAGPDLARLDARFGWTNSAQRHLDIANWNALPDLSGTLLGCDSITVWPAERPRHRTFFEIYGNRLYVRSEDDTVHLNSWVILHSGGSDLDSPYAVMVGAGDPALDDTLVCGPNGEAKVLRPAGVVGSPVAFRTRFSEFLDPSGPLMTVAFSNPYPNMDPTSPFREPRIAGYQLMTLSGRAYDLTRAMDGHRDEDQSVGNAYAIVSRVEAGTATPKEIALREKVLTFYVNQAPHLLYQAPSFVPRPHHVFASRLLALNLLASDPDPYDRSGPTPPGGPAATEVLRWNLRIEGRDANGDLVSFAPLPSPVFTPRIDVTVPEEIVEPDVTLYVQLCDCASCETQPGSGRCVEDTIPVRIPAGVLPVLASLIAASATPDRVLLRWSVAGGGAARVERRTSATEWQSIGEAHVDGSGEVAFEDVAVTTATRYGYRLALVGEGAPRHAGETWVDVPAGFTLALEGARPNPARGGEITIHLSLASAAPARLELLDVNGRRWMDRALAGLGAGRHVMRLADSRMPPGVYLVRLTQNGSVRVARAAVIE